MKEEKDPVFTEEELSENERLMKRFPQKVKYIMRCPHCNKADKYTKEDLVEYNHLSCKKCGQLFPVLLYSDEYIRDENGTLVRRSPKVHMNKKARKKARAEERSKKK